MSDSLADAFSLVMVGTKSVVDEDPAYVYRSFRDTFETDAGQRVLAWLAREAGMFSLNENVLPAEMMREYAGRRHIVHWILKHYALEPAKPEKPAKPVPPLERR
ncbi:MAG: hypothetical protein ACR2QF_11895 [Geminicoccaceae bacterium]